MIKMGPIILYTLARSLRYLNGYISKEVNIILIVIPLPRLKRLKIEFSNSWKKKGSNVSSCSKRQDSTIKSILEGKETCG